MSFVIFDSEIMIWKEEKSRTRGVQMENLRGLLVIRRMDKVLNAQSDERGGRKDCWRCSPMVRSGGNNGVSR